jgi:general secretion pathway protein A
MYEPFFGLNESPFSLAPNPRFLFASASHSAALAQVASALERREPLVVITGDIGTGKTLLCRTVLQRLERKTFLSVISDPLLERDDLLKQLLEDFGVISKDRSRLTATTRHELVEGMHAFLRSLAPIEAHAVVIIDEAQHLQAEVLEQIRLLSNIDDGHGTMLQIILVGQTDLEPLLSRPELRQLQQRVSRRLRLEPLNRDEVQQYIAHRLALARDADPASRAPGAADLARELAEWDGAKAGVEFTPEAIHAVSDLSSGLPRVINLLCDRALELAYHSRQRLVDLSLIQSASAALGIGPQPAPIAVPVPAPIAVPVPMPIAALVPPPIAAPVPKPIAAPVPVSVAVPLPVSATEPGVTAVSEESIWSPPEDESPATETETIASATASRLGTYAALAATLLLAAAAVWFGLHVLRAPEEQAARASAPPMSSPPPASSAVPNPAPAAEAPSVPEAAATTGSNTPPAATAAAPSPAVVPPAAAGFDIVVASFRTDARASSVAAQATALGLPIRRRVSDGWQQVVSGPFATRADAEGAQQRLHRAGLTGTQIVPAVR